MSYGVFTSICGVVRVALNDLVCSRLQHAGTFVSGDFDFESDHVFAPYTYAYMAGWWLERPTAYCVACNVMVLSSSSERIRPCGARFLLLVAVWIESDACAQRLLGWMARPGGAPTQGPTSTTKDVLGRGGAAAG